MFCTIVQVHRFFIDFNQGYKFIEIVGIEWSKEDEYW